MLVEQGLLNNKFKTESSISAEQVPPNREVANTWALSLEQKRISRDENG